MLTRYGTSRGATAPYLSPFTGEPATAPSAMAGGGASAAYVITPGSTASPDPPLCQVRSLRRCADRPRATGWS
jgi:hypothetical protein